MAERPLLTVAVPTMNGARHVGETLRSVLAQTGAAFDLLVCDDRSDDGTLAAVAGAAGDRARVVVNPDRLGLAGNWNECARLCTTPYLAIVHQDDLLRPGHLERHLAAFETGPSVGLAASASGVIDDAGAEVPESVVGRGGLGQADRTFGPGEALASMAAGNPLRCSAVTLRLAAHERAGAFDPAWRYVLDWAHWAEVARAWSLVWFAAPGADVRWHLDSETHRFADGDLDLVETDRLSRALIGSLPGPPALRDALAATAELASPGLT